MIDIALVFLSVVLLHYVLKFTVVWKQLLPCADVLCRVVLYAAIVSSLAGVAAIMIGVLKPEALSLVKPGGVLLVIGITLFFQAITRKHHDRSRLV